MFPGRPMPQPAFTNQISPEALVAAGRLHGRAEADSEKYEEGWHDGYNLGLQHGHTNGWNAAADEANKVINKERLESNRDTLLESVFMNALKDFMTKNPHLKREVLSEIRKNYDCKVKEWLSIKAISKAPHQDFEFLAENPRVYAILKEIF